MAWNRKRMTSSIPTQLLLNIKQKIELEPTLSLLFKMLLFLLMESTTLLKNLKPNSNIEFSNQFLYNATNQILIFKINFIM